MKRRLAAATCAGVLVGTLPVAAAQLPRGAGGDAEQQALSLLETAAEAGRALTWTGTQYAASWREGAADTSLVELRHDPASGSVVTGTADGDVRGSGAIGVLDARLLPHLATAYRLSVGGPGRCTGRDATVVEARRDDGGLAGRFWVDRETGLLLRREVFDGDGDRVLSSAFVDLDVQPGSSGPAARTAAVPAPAAAPDPEALRAQGWHVPDALPAGFALLESRRSGAVLQLAYTDGLSTLSLFAQPGELGSRPVDGFSAERVAGREVWVRRDAAERVVWSGGDRVWTLVSDAPESAVHAAVAALPHDPPPDDGVLARLRRGLARLAGMLNPFD